MPVFSTGESESKIIIVDEISTDKRESESIHKSINKNKGNYAIDVIEHEEPSVKDNPVINDPSYFDLFECGKNLLIRIDAKCK